MRKQKQYNVKEHFVHSIAIRDFVRNILGCQCPEDVFDSIIIGIPEIFPDNLRTQTLQILVGRRLFISVVDSNTLQKPKSELSALLIEGKGIRDLNKFNRFRLAVIGPVPEGIQKYLVSIAQKLDDKMHVHFIPIDSIRKK